MTKIVLRSISTLSLILFIAGIAVAKVPEAVLMKKKAVVTLYIEQKNKIIANGSGFIVNENGIVVTNNHVIEQWNKTKDSLLYIKNSDETFLTPLELIASDADKDVAILKVKETNLPFIQLSNSAPKEGEDVVVIGSPLGLETTITSGIISSIRGKDGLLQISAPISHGSSGSPVLNANGEAIGMASLLMEGGQNLNFAISVSDIVAPIKNISKEKLADLEAGGIIDLKKGEAPAPVNRRGAGHFVKILAQYSAGSYIYNEYDEDGDKGWVVFMADKVDKEKLVPGDYASFPDSPPLINFQSKELGKIFDKVIFADVFRVNIKAAEFKSVKDKDAFLISKMIDNLSYASAYNKITKVLKDNPNNDEVYFLRTKTRISQREVPIEDTPDYHQISATNKLLCQSMYDDLSHAISINNKNDAYYAARGELLMDSLYCNSYDPENALNDYEVAIRLNPKLADYYISKGNIHLNLKQFPQLLECAKEAVRLRPDNDDGYYLYGKYYFARNEYSKALEYVKKGLVHSYKNSQFNLGASLIDDIMKPDKKYDEAVKLYSDLIKKFPKSTLFYGQRGQYYLRSENYKKAITDFSKAINLSDKYSHNSGYHYLRGNAYRSLGDFSAALSDYNFACNNGYSTACENIKAVEADIKRGSNWIFAGSDNNSDLYFDKTSISKNRSGHITVWVKGEITKKDDFIANWEFTPYEKYKNISHTLIQYSLDCQERRLKSMSSLLYTDTGDILSSYFSKEEEFRPAVPGSIGAGILDEACKFSASKKVSKK